MPSKIKSAINFKGAALTAAMLLVLMAAGAAVRLVMMMFVLVMMFSLHTPHLFIYI